LAYRLVARTTIGWLQLQMTNMLLLSQTLFVYLAIIDDCFDPIESPAWRREGFGPAIVAD
jgi:hypothetical protein